VTDSAGETSTTADVLFIGGGVIGLAVAWRAAQRGLSVVVADPDPGGGASHAAAGMLTPVAEAAYAERELFKLGSRSLASYPGFVAELTELTGAAVKMVAGTREELGAIKAYLDQGSPFDYAAFPWGDEDDETEAPGGDGPEP